MLAPIFYSFLGIVLLGALLQTFLPKLIPDSFNTLLESTTIYLTILLLSFVGLAAFLRLRNREGFVSTPNGFERWQQIKNELQLEELCKLKTEIEDKIAALEKGSPPQLTDIQARERAEKTFEEKSKIGVFSCVTFQKLKEINDTDTLFTQIQEVPQTFLAQAYDTALICQQLLEKQLKDVKESLSKSTEEGFANREICSPEITEQRRKWIREQKLTEAAQSCLLPEEVNPERKETTIQFTLSLLTANLDQYKQKYKLTQTLPDILARCRTVQKELDALKQKAESGELKLAPKQE